MALTLNDYSGAETGGLEEAVSAAGVATVSTTNPRSGSYAYRFVADTTISSVVFNPFSIIADAGNDYVLGFSVSFSDTTPDRRTSFMLLSDTNGFILTLRLEVSGNLEILDAQNSTIRTITTPFTDGVDHYIKVYFQHQASATVEVFIDGISQGSDAAQDLTDGGTFNEVRFGNGFDSLTDIDIDDYYLFSGATASSDGLVDAEVYKYQSVKNSVVPDDGGGNLNTGNWDDAGETPGSEANVAIYTTTGAGAIDSDGTNGSPEGPLNDVRIDGDSNIRALKGIWNMQRGTGGGAAHYGLLGNDSDGTARTADFDPPTAYGLFFHLTEASGGAAGDIPLSTEYCRIGFETTGAQNFECATMWAMLLHVPAAVGAANPKGPLGHPLHGPFGGPV